MPKRSCAVCTTRGGAPGTELHAQTKENWSSRISVKDFIQASLIALRAFSGSSTGTVVSRNCWNAGRGSVCSNAKKSRGSRNPVTVARIEMRRGRSKPEGCVFASGLLFNSSTGAQPACCSIAFPLSELHVFPCCFLSARMAKHTGKISAYLIEKTERMLDVLATVYVLEEEPVGAMP